MPIPHRLLSVAHCLLPIAYCLSPIVYCPLPTAYCLLPIAYCCAVGTLATACAPASSGSAAEPENAGWVVSRGHRADREYDTTYYIVQLLVSVRSPHWFTYDVAHSVLSCVCDILSLAAELASSDIGEAVFLLSLLHSGCMVS